jgi:hypothetical protein
MEPYEPYDEPYGRMIEPCATLNDQLLVKGGKLLTILCFKTIIIVYIAGAPPPSMQTYIVQLQRGVDRVPGFPIRLVRVAGEARPQKCTNTTHSFLTIV